MARGSDKYEPLVQECTVSNLLDRWLMVDLEPRELGTEREGREAATCELPKYVSWMS